MHSYTKLRNIKPNFSVLSTGTIKKKYHDTMQQKSRRTNSDPLFTRRIVAQDNAGSLYGATKKYNHSMKMALLVACTWRYDRTILQWTLHPLGNNINVWGQMCPLQIYFMH